MGRHRSRSMSFSPRRSRSPLRRRRYGESHEKRTGLLVRNVALSSRPEDLRIPFERFGPVKDVYLPKNYYTGEPRGFGFVKFRYSEDAAEAKDRLNYTVIGGREIRIVYAEENRKTPHEMRKRTHTSDRQRGSYRWRSSSRSPRRRNHSYSRSPSPARRCSRSVSASRSPHGRYSQSREASPCDERRYNSSRRSLSPKITKDHILSIRSPSRQGSPLEERECGSSRRSQSSKNASHDKVYKSPRRSSGLMDESVLDKSDYRQMNYKLSRSPGSEESSPLDEKEPDRSLSPRRFYPDDSRGKSKGSSLSPNFNDAEASRKPPPPSPRETSRLKERKGKSNKRAIPDHGSPDSRSNCKSSTPVENGTHDAGGNGGYI